MEENVSIRRLRGMSKALSIISKIVKVFLIIVGCFVILSMVIIPLLFKNIKITEHEISVGENTLVEMNQEDNKLTVKFGGNVVVLDEDIEDLKEIIKYFNTDSKGLLVTYIEASLFIAVASLLIMYFVLMYLDKLFTNIYNSETPFTLENADYIRKCAYYLIAFIAVPLILSGVFELITGTEITTNYSLFEVIIILVLFATSYVFEYGYSVENKTVVEKTKTTRKVKEVEE